MRIDRTLGTKRYTNHADKGPWKPPIKETTMTTQRKLTYALMIVDLVLVVNALRLLAQL